MMQRSSARISASSSAKNSSVTGIAITHHNANRRGMMSKARRGRGRGGQDILATLTPERRARGLIEASLVPIEDANGHSSKPLRALDTLACMLREGTITERERKAGDRFHDEFRRAHLDGLFAADTTRIPVVLANGNNGRFAEGSEAARLAVMSALDALGGIASPGGSCAWYVLGLELPLTRWALEIGWGTRRVSRLAASGILLADLGILRVHYA